jgi:hypothetical protein
MPPRAFILASGVVLLAGCDKAKTESSDTPRPPTVAEKVASACKGVDASRMPDASGSRPASGFTPLVVRDSLLRRIDAGEEKWRTGRPAMYQMVVVAACFCRDRGQPVELVVRGDSVIASRDTTGQQSWPDDWRTGLHIAGLFREARQYACDSTRTTRVTIDPTLGYPTLLRTESRLEMSDTDREYRVLSFAPREQ